MNKAAFLAALRSGLEGLPPEDIEKSAEYYSEIIDDRVEEGCSEEEAAAALGNVDDIVSQILIDTPLPKLVRAKVKPKRSLRGWEIALLILGSPVWVPLVLTAAILLLSVYIVIWSVIISLYAVDLSIAAAGLACIAAAFPSFLAASAAQGLLFLGAGFLCAGIAILLFFCFNLITKALILLSKKILQGIKSCFVRKGTV